MDKRRKAFWKGHGAEYYAALFLQLRGYRLIARRYKSPVGEIDLILTKGDVLVMVEVKFRRALNRQIEAGLNEAIFAVTDKTQRRISHAASMFIAQNPQFSNAGLRYDIIAISGLSLRHIKDAWRD